MNYLELVNEAVKEAGVELDPLTAADFASPSGAKMYDRFKSWVALAWQDIQTDNKEWFFSNVAVVNNLRPRIRVKSALYPSGAGFAGKQFYNGNVLIEIVDDGHFITGDNSLGTGELFLDINPTQDLSKVMSNMEFVEDTLDPNPASFRISVGPGYAVTEIDDRIDAIVKKDVTLLISNTEFPIKYVPWKNWHFDLKNEYGRPRQYTVSPEGFLHFYPNLKDNAVISAYANLLPQILTAYSDTPRGLAPKFHQAIYWKAVASYANYDKDNGLWQQANRNYMKMMTYMDRDLSTAPRFAESLYYGG